MLRVKNAARAVSIVGRRRFVAFEGARMALNEARAAALNAVAKRKPGAAASAGQLSGFITRHADFIKVGTGLVVGVSGIITWAVNRTKSLELAITQAELRQTDRMFAYAFHGDYSLVREARDAIRKQVMEEETQKAAKEKAAMEKKAA